MKHLIATAILLLSTTASLAASGEPVQVLLKTSMGDIQLALDPQKSPATVANFVQLLKNKHYDGLIFHRVIQGFMIQAGGFNEYMSPKEPASKPIKNESYNGLKNHRGTVAMARTSDPNSARAQFFINLDDNWNLDKTPQNPGYAVFGKVTKGMEVVDKIARVPVGKSGPHDDVPRQPVRIIEATLLDAQ
ncbi:MAG: peptidylprolyl isomerase [Porticoccus sp.]|uniref:peptidylprolyl isomerase n=1 Tax=Porticoccus TaxID=1123967 RepID=UPI000C5D31D3|nr:peptidylprolyl isomerase [Porticoccus hydrocarbonoclasticus]MBG57694.1 peptidylprolyl isomerase A [Porticoccus sp.]|tara:strand:+ start:6444 stop:7013 length:570 start_codon:yes stop_codon:yes gene_type:complete